VLKRIKALKSQVTMTVRGMYSSPPNHGACTVSTILNNDALKKEWSVWNIKNNVDSRLINYDCICLIMRLDTLKIMTNRIKYMRKSLRENLETLRTTGTWNHITDQPGMFSYTGLSGIIIIRNIKEKNDINFVFFF